MKHFTKYIAMGVLGASLMFSSCSDSWLDKTPTGSASAGEVNGNVDNMKQAINGICKLMTMQHAYYGQGFNGEGTIMLMYADYMGEDFYFPVMAPGWALMMNGNMNDSNTSIYDAYPWYYYYTIVGNANTILANVDAAEGTEAELGFLKASALTFRAYAFSQLVQFYCDSWKNSNNGASDGIVLRLDESTGDMPLSTLAECYAQIYTDLDEAVSLFQASGLNRSTLYGSSAVCFPDLNVAYGVYARAALNREDYGKAAEMAALARNGYPLMSNADYRAGFCAPTSEWIWGSYNDAAETLYYWSFQVSMAYNGYYATNGYNTAASRELIDAIPDTDVRKGLFVHPGTFLEEGQTVEDVITWETKDGSMPNAYGEFGNSILATTDGMSLDVIAYQDINGNLSLESDYPGYQAALRANAYAESVCSYTPALTVTPYTALKFAAVGMPGIGCIPFIRSSEMLLIEAEAAYQNGDEAGARNALMELNATSGRDAAYTCNKTGDDLWNEIILYRRLELWGEGHSWFDCKRWGRPVVRKGITEGGNFHAAIAGTYGADPNSSFWKWVLPSKETDYNSGLNMPE